MTEDQLVEVKRRLGHNERKLSETRVALLALPSRSTKRRELLMRCSFMEGKLSALRGVLDLFGEGVS